MLERIRSATDKFEKKCTCHGTREANKRETFRRNYEKNPIIKDAPYFKWVDTTWY